MACGDSGFCNLSKTLFHGSFFLLLLITNNKTPQQDRTLPREEEEEAGAGKRDMRNSRRRRDSLRNLETPGKITPHEIWKHQWQLSVGAVGMA